MATPRRTVQRGQDLAIAPADIRCRHVIERDDGTSTQCSRFTIKLPGGERDPCCVSHSTTDFAALLRSKGSKARRAAEDVDRERLRGVAHDLLPRMWRNRREIQRGRFRLYQAIIRRDVSVAQAKLLQSLIHDAEGQMKTQIGDWGRGSW